MKFLAAISLVCLVGCTVVSANRTFPKLSWYWSKDAQLQRESKKRDLELRERAITNSPPAVAHPEPSFLRGDALVEKVRKRDGTNFLGVYMGMIAERYDGVIWPDTNRVNHSVQMFSATSGQLLKWISAEDFTNIFVLKNKPEYTSP